MDIDKLNIEFYEEDLLEIIEINQIENKIAEVTSRLSNTTSIPSYTPKTWVKSDFLLITYLNNIENGIENIGKYYYKPYGWQKTKTWKAKESFSYKDLNRWINDLNIVIDRLNNESSSLFPSDTLYPNETLLPR